MFTQSQNIRKLTNLKSTFESNQKLKVRKLIAKIRLPIHEGDDKFDFI